MARWLCSVCAALALFVLAAGCGTGTTEYIVIVHFDTSVTQEDMDAVDAYLRGYDNDLEFLVQETFPPTGVARLEAKGKNICETIEQELPAFRGVAGVECSRAEDGIPVGGDTPVSYP